MPPQVWTVLADFAGRSLVEIREDGLLWIRQDMTLDEAHAAVNQLATRYALTLPVKVSHASH